MESLYSRNRIYITPEQQEKIRNTRILLGGAGLGSEIAECALRLGFEKITIIDGDKVELSNLNRQNYTRDDIGKYKAESLALRLLSINPDADIRFHNELITLDNINNLINNCDIAINALDFKDETPIHFDERCRQIGIYTLHPYNFGWGSIVMITAPNGLSLIDILNEERPEYFKLKMLKYIQSYNSFWNVTENKWLQEIEDAYSKAELKLSIPGLSVGAWIAAALTVNAMVELIQGHQVRLCPKFYMTALLSDHN